MGERVRSCDHEKKFHVSVVWMAKRNRDPYVRRRKVIDRTRETVKFVHICRLDALRVVWVTFP